jgi:hypothetical protein
MRKITILGREVEMLYCAATETGFEDIAGKTADIFNPIPVLDKEGKVKELMPPPATTKDYIYLAVACIVAAYASRGEEAPNLTNDILYNATPAEVQLLTKTAIELKLEWYKVPTTATIDKMKDEGKGKKKNVKQPATSSRQS